LPGKLSKTKKSKKPFRKRKEEEKTKGKSGNKKACAG
jgi:hypothetical protein